MIRPPPTPTHRGVVRTRDLWFDGELLGEDELRRRVLERWRAGATLRHLGPGRWLSLPDPIRVDTRTSRAGVLLPAGPDRVASAEGAGPPGAWLFRGGAWVGGAAPTLPAEDPSSWLALPARLVSTRPLGDPPPVALAAAPLALDLRKRLGFSDQATRALSALTSAAPPLPGARLARGLQWGMARALSSAAQVGSALAGRTELGRTWMQRLESYAATLGLHSVLEAAVGAHNARYLQQLMARLEGGDWLEAIQQAIPLGGAGTGGDGGLAWLSALKGLRWSTGTSGGGAVGAGPDFYERLRALYRKAFEALDAAGRHREAAYVLAELLNLPGDAVEYLERNREYQVAAELVEAKKLDIGLAVHLWILAGEEDRALALAAAHGAYAVAVEHLERRGETERATGLRLRWAWREHRAGRVVAAVDIAWKVEIARPVASAWLAEARTAGGVGGARALARSMLLRPEARAEDLAVLREVLASDTVAARLALAEALDGAHPFSRRVLRATARALLRDSSHDVGAAVAAAAGRAGDGALAADLPSLPAPSPVRWPPDRVHCAVSKADTGLQPLYDAVPLSRSRWLVAAGESGALLVAADGRRLTTLAAPAHRVVTTPEGTRLLLLGRRVDRFRVHQISFPQQRVERWVDVAATAITESCDGSVWFVAQDERVLAVDLHATTLRALWSTAFDGPVLALEWEPTRLDVVVRTSALLVERFRYELPSLTLRQRAPLTLARGATLFAVSSGGVASAGDTRVELAADAVSHLERDGVTSIRTRADQLLVTTPAATELYERDGLGFRPRLVVETTGADRAFARFVQDPDGALLAATGDDRGRLRVVDLSNGQLRQDLRIR